MLSSDHPVKPHWAITTITSLAWVVVNNTEAMPGQKQPNSATPSNVIVGEVTLAWGRKINIGIIVMIAQLTLRAVIRVLRIRNFSYPLSLFSLLRAPQGANLEHNAGLGLVLLAGPSVSPLSLAMLSSSTMANRIP